MQMLEDESQRVNEEIAHRKDSIKAGTVEMDRLRSEKADLEKKVARHKLDADDGRAVDLCDWYVLLPGLRSLGSLDLMQVHIVPGTSPIVPRLEIVPIIIGK